MSATIETKKNVGTFFLVWHRLYGRVSEGPAVKSMAYLNTIRIFFLFLWGVPGLQWSVFIVVYGAV